ncbi:MAG: hypothetical protein K2G04_01635, partial [Oscillospiraceae bacterium]|nr:hypothetical protein [Oscillospiraceae bacterium]
MTLEERSRAKRLEKLSRVYEKHIITRRTVLTVTIVIMALLYALWLFVDVGGYIPSTHVFFAVLIMGLY